MNRSESGSQYEYASAPTATINETQSIRVITHPCSRMTAYPTTTMTTAALKNWRLVASVGRIAAARASVRGMLDGDLRGYPVEKLRETEFGLLSCAVLTLPVRQYPVLMRRILLRRHRGHIPRSLR